MPPGVEKLASVAIAVALSLASSGVEAGGAVHTVVIEGVKYSPAAITVKRGDTVVWVNKDPFPHTVTSRGNFDSKGIPADGKWTYVARRAGAYDYVCTYHPNMKGRLTVQ
jgi:plastocyanin